MFVLTIVLAVILLGLIVWWLNCLRHGQPPSEKPDETVRKVQRREL